MNEYPRIGGLSVALALLGPLMIVSSAAGQEQQDRPKGDKPKYRGILGRKSKKIKRVDGKTLLAASRDPTSPDAEWYDFTGSVIPPEDLQFGIGKDRIPAIDDPVFVKPDDSRLLELPNSPYRKGEEPKTTDDIQVAGFLHGDQARAYPVGLLDYHELVNVDIGGKPVTVGW